jgi:hypothetical protein
MKTGLLILKKKNVYEGSKRVFKKIYSDERFKNKISNNVKKETISDCYFAIYKHHMCQNNKPKALINITLSILTCPNRQFKHKIYLLISSFDILSSTLKLKNEYKVHP